MTRYLIKAYLPTNGRIDEQLAESLRKAEFYPQQGEVRAKVLKAFVYDNMSSMSAVFLVRCSEEEKQHLEFSLRHTAVITDYSTEEYYKYFWNEKPEEPKRTRKPWDQYFIEQAIHVAERGTCSRARVGCVLVKENRVIATGYNGSPKGMPHCDDIGHLMKDGHCVRTNHAEENALLQCARLGISSEGATAYVTHEPCLYCTRQLNQAGIKRIVYVKPYPNDYNEYFIGDMDWEQYEGAIENGNN